MYERFMNNNPTISLGWVVCGIRQADQHWVVGDYDYIIKDGIMFKRSINYYADSPYDWDKVE